MVKIAKRLNKYEPTLSDVLEAVQTGFARVDDRFEQVNARFDAVDERFDRLERRAGSLENTVEDMKETLGGVAHAVDKDAIAILNHERRIRLEKANA